MSLEDYLPKARLEPPRRKYLGSGGAEVYSTLDGSRVLVTSTPAPPAVVQQSQAAAVDIYADMDFRPFLVDGGLRVNAGEISSVEWDGLSWVQEYESVPITEVVVTATTTTKYLHLIVPIQTFESTPGDIVTPWYVNDKLSYLTATPFSFAQANNWQGIAGTPRYEITTLEGPPSAIVPGTVPNMDVLIASLHSVNGLRIFHVGPVNLSQGHLADLVSISP